jgi:exopolyphosphatase/guanosine-5'-triphosphate,3'-diphosphate pyrophosphatase
MARRTVLALLSMLALALACLQCSGEPPQVETPKPAPTCRLRRAAFDIGSATTKVKVADIDLCAHRIIKVLLAEDAAVFYRDDLIDKPEGEALFREQTLARGMEVLRHFKERADALKPGGYAAVATSSFRRAQNGVAFLERVKAELGITARVISQAEEAELGFLGAVASAHVDPRNAVVWDVGGESMQLAILAGADEMRIYTGRFASGQMRQHLLRDVQHRGPEVTSPNPVSKEEAQQARAYAAAFAQRDVPEFIKQKLARKGTVVVGIGALKYFPDARPDDAALATIQGLERSIDEMLGKTDAEIGGPYASTHISDRLLITGFMEGLGVRWVVLADVDLGDGLMFHEDYWESDHLTP